MDSELTPWLEEAVAQSVQLGWHWLQKGVQKGTLNNDYLTGLYTDNGSSLDIAYDLHIEKRKVQVIKVSPLTLSDGAYSIEAILSPACKTDLSERYRDIAGAVINLHSILTALDWHRGPCHLVSLQPRPVHLGNQVAVFLRRLEITRASQDQTYAYEDTMSPSESSGGNDEDNVHPQDAGSASSPPEAIQVQSQFGTQAVSPARNPGMAAVPGYDRDRSVGSKNENKRDDRQAKLLGLLHKDDIQDGVASSTPQPKRSVHSNLRAGNTPAKVLQRGSNKMTPPHKPATQHVKPSWAAAPNFSQTAQNPGNMAKSSSTDADWMRGYQFNVSTAWVDPAQQSLVNKPTSWQKPEPGNRFPEGNIPIDTLNRIQELLVQDTSNKAVAKELPNDQLLPQDLSLDEHPLRQPSLEPLASSSQVSWSPSPSPFRPKRNWNDPELPPDSSFEGRRDSNPSNAMMPGTASSPPDISADLDSDGDLRMELSVPQALGEDLSHSLSLRRSSGIAHPKSVVQVQESSQLQAKSPRSSAATDHQSSHEIKTSSGDLKTTSSISIIHGTYKESGTTKNTASSILTKHHVPHDTSGLQKGFVPLRTIEAFEAASPGEFPSEADPRCSLARAVESFTEVPCSDDIAQEHLELVSTLAHPTRIGTLIESEQAKKRKLPRSPSASPHKKTQPKIKKLDLQGARFFSKGMPSSDIDTDFVRQRKDFMRQHSARNDLLDAQAEIPSGNTGTVGRSSIMTSPINLGAHSHPEGGRGPINLAPDLGVERQSSGRTADQNPSSRLLPVQKSVSTDSRFPSPSFNTRLTKLQLRDNAGVADQLSEVPITSPRPARLDAGIGRDHHNLEETTPTVFDRFKETYPKYTGDVNHFFARLREMYNLEQQDRMVPKWQWDDFLIRHRVEYKHYCNEMIEGGETPVEYVRWYKKEARFPVHVEGVLEDDNTFAKALEELNYQPLPNNQLPRASEFRRRGFPSAGEGQQSFQRLGYRTHQGFTSDRSLQGSSSPAPAPRRQSRKLPKMRPQLFSAFDNSERNGETANRDKQKQTPPATPKSPLNSRSLIESSQKSWEGTGNIVHKFMQAHARITSWTGSTKVSNSPWPHNMSARPAISRSSTPDILSWTDTL